MLSLALFVFSLFYMGLKVNNDWFRKFSVQCIVSACLALFASTGIQLLAGISIGPGFNSLVQRGDAGRFMLWKIWIESGLSKSLLFGHGLGFNPDLNDTIQFTPHNFLVQLLADSGLSGLLVACLLVFCCFGVFKKSLRSKAFAQSSKSILVFICIGSLFFNMMFSSMLFWSSDVWCLSIFIIGASEYAVALGDFVCLFDEKGDCCNVVLNRDKYVGIGLIYIVVLAIFVTVLSAWKYWLLN